MTITSDSVSPPTLTVKPRRTDLLYDAKPRSFVIRGKHSAEALQFISKHLSLRKNEKTSRKMKKTCQSMFSCKILDSLGQLSTRGLTQTAVSCKH